MLENLMMAGGIIISVAIAGVAGMKLNNIIKASQYTQLDVDTAFLCGIAKERFDTIPEKLRPLFTKEKLDALDIAEFAEMLGLEPSGHFIYK